MSALAEAPPVTPGPLRAIHIGPEGLPPLTLGWHALAWTHRWLRQPDGPNAKQPWMYTPEQARLLLWWYAINEEGEFIYRSGLIRRMKGWGKDPFLSTICALEFVGPCRFGGWKYDRDGNHVLDARGNWEPIVIEHQAAWVQLAAVSKDQTRNTMRLFPGLFSPEAIAEFRIDLGQTIIYAHGGTRVIEAVTSSATALEGGRTTFTLKNETQHWKSGNGGHDMADVISRNATKSRDGSSRFLGISNAHNPGEDSDAEHDYETYQAIVQGRVDDDGFLYDSLEAPPEIDIRDPEQLREGIRLARGDSVWLNVERIFRDFMDPRNPVSNGRRFFLNQIVAAEDAWVAPHEWASRSDPTKVLQPGDMITLGFDGSTTDDWTALVACRVADNHYFTLGLWDPARFGGEAPRERIDGAVRMAFNLFDVVGFYSDVSPWESYVDRWSEELGRGDRKGRGGLCVSASARSPIGWDMRGRQKDSTFAAEAFHDAILEDRITHDGNPGAMQNVYNARRRPNQYGVSFGKEHRESARKVDWLAAAILAFMARRDYMALPESRKRRVRTGRAVF